MTLSTVIFLDIFFLPNLQLNIGIKYLKTAKIIDESLILAIVLPNYSAEPSYIFQLKRELKFGNIYLVYSTSKGLSKTEIRSFDLCYLFVFTFHEYEARFVFGFRMYYKLSLFIFFLCVKLFCVLFMCYNQYKLNNSSDAR
jgi:hypothetical protein